MPNLFHRSASLLGSKLQTAGGWAVTYLRGSEDPISLVAVPVITTYSVQSADGALTLVESWDWTFVATELGIDPLEGDLITDVLNSRVYEVMRIGDQPEFTCLDTSRVLLTVHSKVI